MREQRHWRQLAGPVPRRDRGARPAGGSRVVSVPVRPRRALVRLGTADPRTEPVGRRAARGAEAAGLRGRPGGRASRPAVAVDPARVAATVRPLLRTAGARAALRRAGHRPDHRAAACSAPGAAAITPAVDHQAAHLDGGPGVARPDGAVPDDGHAGRPPPASSCSSAAGTRSWPARPARPRPSYPDRADVVTLAQQTARKLRAMKVHAGPPRPSTTPTSPGPSVNPAWPGHLPPRGRRTADQRAVGRRGPRRPTASASSDDPAAGAARAVPRRPARRRA